MTTVTPLLLTAGAGFEPDVELGGWTNTLRYANYQCLNRSTTLIDSDGDVITNTYDFWGSEKLFAGVEKGSRRV